MLLISDITPSQKITFSILLGLWLGVIAVDQPITLPGITVPLQHILGGLLLLASGYASIRFRIISGMFNRFFLTILFYALFCLYLLTAWFFFNNGMLYIEKLQPILLLPTIPFILYIAVSFLADRRVVYTTLWIFILADALLAIAISSYLPRANGLSNNPNATAVFMAFGIILSFFLATGTQNKKQKLFFMAGTLPMLTAISLTASRTGFLCLLLATLSITLWRHYGPKRFLIAAYIISMLFIPVLTQEYRSNRFWGSFTSLIEKNSAGLETKENSEALATAAVSSDVREYGAGQKNVARRWATDKIAFSMFLDAPVFGKGLGGNKKNYGEYYKRGGKVLKRKQPFTTHNAYLSLLSETGLIGFTLYVGFLASTGRLIFEMRANKMQPDTTKHIWLIASYIVFLVAGLTWLIYLKKAFWVCLSIIAAECVEQKERRNPLILPR